MISKVVVGAARRAARNISIIRPMSAVTWSKSLTYATPESDFSDPSLENGQTQQDSSEPVWSKTLSFASPEADFSHVQNDGRNSETVNDDQLAWSRTMSFASPESDFVAPSDLDERKIEWSEGLSFATPESDFQATKSLTGDRSSDFLDSGILAASPVMHLAVSIPESATGSMHAYNYLNTEELVQVHNERLDATPLPTTLSEALDTPDDSRAIVVTEAKAPFRIVDVNDAWVGLCGFSKEEARNHKLDIIQGPETSNMAVNSMISELLHGHEASALVTNYTKSGRKFYNHLRAGPIMDENQHITHFVGILKEVTEEPDYFHMAA